MSGGASGEGARLGGTGVGASQNNIMMDGVSAMDTGNNGQMLNMNIESIGEVRSLPRATRPSTADRAVSRSPP